VWAGAGALGANDGWLVLADTERAPLLLPEPLEIFPEPPGGRPESLAGQPEPLQGRPEPSAEERSPLAGRVLEALAGSGALFFRQIADAVESTEDADLLLALWDLVWAGRVTNDTLAPLRAYLRRAVPRPGPRSSPIVRRRPHVRLARLGPPAGAGRWSLVPERDLDPTRRLHAAAEQLLARHGLVTPGAVNAEGLPGGFAGVYPVFKIFEEAGRCRRGYFVEGLGGAQFALLGAVDRMRSFVQASEAEARALVLAATDPANPYGAALAWPERPEARGDSRRRQEDDARAAAGRTAHRPGRKAGAVVVLVEGRLALYVERGGRTLLSYEEDESLLRPAVEALAEAARAGMLGKLSVEKADGGAVLDTPLAKALVEAGFRATPRGLRVRG
jgi:ATP-dependent helicase Lhr and Lhr-like helicase